MIKHRDIRAIFKNMKEFEEFSERWVRVCARLNEKGENAEILSWMEETRTGYMECMKL